MFLKTDIGHYGAQQRGDRQEWVSHGHRSALQYYRDRDIGVCYLKCLESWGGYYKNTASGSRGTPHHVPPALACRSNTLITSKACSWAKASTAMAPAGPAPITATDLMGVILAHYKTCELVWRQSWVRSSAWNTMLSVQQAPCACTAMVLMVGEPLIRTGKRLLLRATAILILGCVVQSSWDLPNEDKGGGLNLICRVAGHYKYMMGRATLQVGLGQCRTETYARFSRLL